MEDRQEELKRENPWESPDCPRFSPVSLVLAATMFVLASLALPLAFYSRVLAIAAWGLCMVGALYLTRQAKGGFWRVLLLSIVAFVLLQSVLVTTDGYRLVIALSVLLGLITVGISVGSYLGTAPKLIGVLPLLSVAAAGIVFAVLFGFLQKSWQLSLQVSLPALLLLIPSLALAIATKKGAYRSMAVCVAAVGLLVGAVGLFLILVWRWKGAVSVDALQAVLADFRNAVVQQGIALRAMYLEDLRAMIAENPDWNADQVAYANSLISQIGELYSDTVLQNATAKVFNMLPGFLFILCAVPAFLAQSLLNATYVSNKMRAVLTPESEFFTMSIPAAVLYLIATFIMLGFSSSLSIAVTVADNLCLMLCPGFLVLAVRGFRRSFRQARGFGRVATVFLIIMAFSLLSVTAIPVLGIYGAYLRIYAALRKRLEHSGNGGQGF